MTRDIAAHERLPALITKAARALASATTAAEVLEAGHCAQFAYNTAKSAARFVEIGKAHARVVAVCHKAMGDALLIEARAKIRLADEYDAAQARNEIASRLNAFKFYNPRKPGHRTNAPMISTMSDIGVTPLQLRDARGVRNLEKAHPGTIERAINDEIGAGKAPSRKWLNYRCGKISAVVRPPSPKQQKLKERNAKIVSRSDNGHPAKEIAGEFEIVTRAVHRVLEVEKAKREAVAEAEIKIDSATLPMSAQEKLAAAIRQAKKNLEYDFDQRIADEVRKRLEDTILPSYAESYQKYQDVIKGRDGVMTKEAYKKILSCLHPDRIVQLVGHALDPSLAKRYAEAFHLFRSMEDRLLSEKENPTPSMTMPRTYADLMEMKRKVAEERRAKRANGQSAGKAV